MEHSELVYDLALALAAAFAGGWVARRFGQPVLIGYLIAGILIGPNTPGYAADRERVPQLAELGVAFLMFGLGVEFSLSELLRVRKIVSLAGSIQIPFTIVLGIVVGLLSGWNIQASCLLGGAFAISSSIVTLTWLMSRGEVDSPQAHVALGLGVVQDLALVPMIALLPVLSNTGENVPLELLKSVGIATVALVLVIVLGTRLVPRILYAVARVESRELFLLVVVLIALGTALASQEAGLSLALGAFLAGLVVSESEYDRQVLSEIIPLRDLFATLFFVSIGMLVDPAYIASHVPQIAMFTSALVIGKMLIIGGALLAAGVNHTTATLVAVFMAQMGEFSFVLAGAGSEEHVIDDNQFGVIMATAVASILLTPLVVRMAPALVDLAARLPGVAAQELAIVGDEPPGEELKRHTIICGYGRVGTVLGDALDRRNFAYTVVEINPAIVRDLRRRGIHAVYGDAGNEPVLDHAGIRHARVLVVASVDLVATPAAIRYARKVNPSISIVTRAQAASEVELLRAAGANEIVQPEFEAGLECVRYVMRRYGVSAQETNAIVGRRRTAHYRAAVAGAPEESL
ncbi:MAG: cation:proton antiporter [Thermomicrobiales bacterium]